MPTVVVLSGLGVDALGYALVARGLAVDPVGLAVGLGLALPGHVAPALPGLVALVLAPVPAGGLFSSEVEGEGEDGGEGVAGEGAGEEGGEGGWFFKLAFSFVSWRPPPPGSASTAVARKRTQTRSIATFIVQKVCLRTGRAVARGRTRAPAERHHSCVC